MRADVDAGVNGRLPRDDLHQVDILVAAKLARIATDQGHQPHEKLQPTGRKGSEIETLRLVGGAGLRILGGVAGGLKSEYSRLMQLDVVGVAVAAELVVAYDDLRPVLADRGDDLACNALESAPAPGCWDVDYPANRPSRYRDTLASRRL